MPVASTTVWFFIGNYSFKYSHRFVSVIYIRDSVVSVCVLTVTGIPWLCVCLNDICVYSWHCLLRLNPRPISQLVVSSFSRAVALPIEVAAITMTTARKIQTICIIRPNEHKNQLFVKQKAFSFLTSSPRPPDLPLDPAGGTAPAQTPAPDISPKASSSPKTRVV